MTVLSPDQLKSHRPYVGSKSTNLYTLSQQGFNVPSFLVLPSTTIKKIDQSKFSKELQKLIIKDVKQQLNSTKFFIRSNALVEDTQTTSMAGQFLTKGNVTIDNMIQSITTLIEDAKNKLSGNLDLFSIIIQKQITPDISGVIFTRNPQGKRNAIIEYHHGFGEDLVSGKIKPKTQKFYWSDFSNQKCILTNNFLKKCLALELKLNHPQDIEFVIADGQQYALQTRPITSINADSFKQIQYIESIVPETPFCFKKTSVAESIPRPTPLSLSLLDFLYQHGHSIDLAYKEYKIRYTYTKFTRIFGNELFVDTLAEMQQLFPTATNKNGNLNIRLSLLKLKDLIRTVINYIRIASLQANKQRLEVLQKKLSAIIKTSNKKLSLNDSLNDIIKSYKTIYQINLLAQKSMLTLETALKTESIDKISVLQHKFTKLPTITFNDNILLNLIGNSIDIADQTKFKFAPTHVNHNKVVESWMSKLPKYKQAYLIDKIATTQNALSLREYARLATVIQVNNLRKAISQNLPTKYISFMFYLELQELLNNNLPEVSILEKRKNEYEKYMQFTLPRIIISTLNESINQLIAVSHGSVTAKVISLDKLKSYTGSDKPILFSPNLSPQLVSYFDKISGIVSETGGVLSHLGIMARENNIPVLSGVNKDDIVFRQYYALDTNNLLFKKVDSP